MRISDWSSDVCSSDLRQGRGGARSYHPRARLRRGRRVVCRAGVARRGGDAKSHYGTGRQYRVPARGVPLKGWVFAPHGFGVSARRRNGARSEEHTSELQSLMRISYAVLCLIKKKTTKYHL